MTIFEGMRKYFYYDNEYISGWKYWLRSLLQGYLIFLFGLGAYLLAVTAYKRAKSLGHSESGSLFFAIYSPVSWVLGFMFGYTMPDTYMLPALIICIPHWYLWFSNGTPPIQPEEVYSGNSFKVLDDQFEDLESQKEVEISSRKENSVQPIINHKKNLANNIFSRQESTDEIEKSYILQELEKLFVDNSSVHSIKIYAQGKVERYEDVNNIKIELSAFEHTLFNYYKFIQSRLANIHGEMEFNSVYNSRLSVIKNWFEENNQSTGKKLGMLN